MKNKKIISAFALLSVAFLLSACNTPTKGGPNPDGPGPGPSNEPGSSNDPGNPSDTGSSADSGSTGDSSTGLSENENTEVTDIETPEDTNNEEFSITCDDMSTITKVGNIYTISTSVALVYSVSGKLSGQIIVDSTARVELDLNNVSIECDQNSPIYVKASDDVEIKSPNGTINYIYDKRSVYTTDVDGQGKGAIYAEDGDLKFTGKGTIKVEAGYYNGIHAKDDFSLKNTKIEITAPHNGNKANDGI